MNIEVLLEKLASPAQKALLHANITTFEELAEHTESEILDLHGIDRNAMAVIKATLGEHGLALKE
jgi:hypothetical protein